MALRTVDLRDDAGAVVEVVAAADPRRNVGLIPDPDDRNWRVWRNPGHQFLLPPCTDHDDTLEATLRCMASRRPPVPIAAWQCGSYTCIYCDHGLGDVRIIQMLGALLTNPAANVARFPFTDARTRHPVLRALSHALRTDPRHLCTDVLSTIRLTLTAAKATFEAANHVEETPLGAAAGTVDSALTVAFVNGSLVEDIRRHRDDHNPGVTLSALLMHRTYEGFAAAGVSMPCSVDVPIDLRRYLPVGVTTPANFQALVRVPLSPGTSAATFAASLKRELQSYTPLLLLVRWLILSRARTVLGSMGRRRAVHDVLPSVARPITLTLVDNTRWIADSSISWREPEGSVFVGMVPPETRDHIAITFSISGDGRMQATATFHASRISRTAVEQALSAAIVVG